MRRRLVRPHDVNLDANGRKVPLPCAFRARVRDDVIFGVSLGYGLQKKAAISRGL
jgi:hypothetical protein